MQLTYLLFPTMPAKTRVQPLPEHRGLDALEAQGHAPGAYAVVCCWSLDGVEADVIEN